MESALVMSNSERPNSDEKKAPKVERFRLPLWSLGIGLLIPPAWPFLLVALAASYPKTTAVIAGSTVFAIGGTLIMASEKEKADQRYKEAQATKEQEMLPKCRAKYNGISSIPNSDTECFMLLIKSERIAAASNESAKSMANFTAEMACRRAVKNSLSTTDGYHIPLGSVKTAPYIGHKGQFVTKFPFTVKNEFGVRMKHGVECVATGEGSVNEVNQLF